MFRGCAPKCCLKNNAKFGEGIVQGVRKLTQTGILWSQVQVLVAQQKNKPSSEMVGVLSFERHLKKRLKTIAFSCFIEP
jgi:hypothetical protein